MRISAILLMLLMWSANPVGAQYMMGVPENNDSALLQLREKTTLIRANYKSLGSSASLKKYCPVPGMQNPYGTCAAWSTAYAGRTIIEAERKGWTSRSQITANAFSPMFIYKANNPSDNSCNQGAHPADLLTLMQRTGVPLYSDYPTYCKIPESADYSKARPNAISSLQRLFFHEPYTGNEVTTPEILKIKKSIEDGNPVIISFVCPPSFQNAGEIWQPWESPLVINNTMHGRHAVCVIGYDDDKAGGGFEIMNSWSTNWGLGGFTWIPYSVFRKFCYAAVELGKFEEEGTLTKLSGSVQLLDPSNTEIKASRIANYHYRLTTALSSGSRFKLFVNNTEPANMYVIGADNRGNYSTLFPYNRSVSPFINHPRSTIAIPAEDKHIRLDNNTGKDFMLVIYTKNPDFDINGLISQLQNAQGSFPEKVATVMRSTIASNKTIYTPDKISFVSVEAQKSDVLLLIEIEHN